MVIKVYKQDHHYSSLHCPSYNYPYISIVDAVDSQQVRIAATYICRDVYVRQCKVLKLGSSSRYLRLAAPYIGMTMWGGVRY